MLFAPQAFVFLTSWPLEKIFERAAKKLPPAGTKYTRAFLEGGVEIKQVGDILPEKPLYFSEGANYAGPKTKERKDESKDAEEPPAETNDDVSSGAPVVPGPELSGSEEGKTAAQDVAESDEGTQENKASQEDKKSDNAASEPSAEPSVASPPPEPSAEPSAEPSVKASIQAAAESTTRSSETDGIDGSGTGGRSAGDDGDDGDIAEQDAQSNENQASESKKKGIFGAFKALFDKKGREDGSEQQATTDGKDGGSQPEGSAEPKSDKDSFFDRMRQAANKVMEKNKTKFQNVLSRAKEAMKRVEAEQQAAAAVQREEDAKRKAKVADAGAAESARPASESKAAASPRYRPPPLAALEVCVVDARGIDVRTAPYIAVGVEGVVRRTPPAPPIESSDDAKEAPAGSRSRDERYRVAWSGAPLTFEVGDVTGDIHLTLLDATSTRRDEKVARVIVPIKWLQSSALTGGWRPFDKWLKLFPLPGEAGVTSVLVNELGGWRAPQQSDERKYEQALPKEKGSGLPDPQAPLGEVRVRIRAAPVSDAGTAALYQSYLIPSSSGAPSVQFEALDRDVDDMLNDSEAESRVLSLEGIQRLIFRLKNLFGGSALLRPPWSLATLAWLYWMCFRASASGAPWGFWTLLLLQGLSVWVRRDFSGTLVWESQVQTGRAKTLFERGAMLRRGLRVLGAFQYKLGVAVSLLERAKNAMSWADPTASVLLYAGLGGLCFVAQLLIAVLPRGLPAFALGLSVLAPPWVKLVRGRLGGKGSKGKGGSGDSGNHAHDDMGKRIQRLAMQLGENYANHVPDAEELAHRRICEMQVVAARDAANGRDSKDGGTPKEEEKKEVKNK